MRSHHVAKLSPNPRPGPRWERGQPYVFSVLAAPVAQTCSLSVSVEIVAIRDDFSERGSATRSTLESQHRSNWLTAFLVSGCFGSQTRAPLVAASPRCAVSQVFNLPPAACKPRSADYKSAIRQIRNLRYGEQIPHSHVRASLVSDPVLADKAVRASVRLSLERTLPPSPGPIQARSAEFIPPGSSQDRGGGIDSACLFGRQALRTLRSWLSSKYPQRKHPSFKRFRTGSFSSSVVTDD